MSNQDYTQGGQDAQGMDQDSYGSMQEPDPMDPRRMNPNQMGPSQLDPSQMDLNQMGQGDQDMYAQPQGGSMNRDQSDRMRGNIDANASDRFERERAGGGGDTSEEFRDMVGGMYGEDDDSQSDR